MSAAGPVVRSAFISTGQLAELVAELVACGTRVIAPARSLSDGGTRVIAPAQPPSDSDAARDAAERDRAAVPRPTYRVITDFGEATFNDGLPALSLKGFFLPPSEALLTWRQEGGDVELTPAPVAFAEQLILGPRPCDVAALEVVDAVMSWDYDDELWNGRRAATTILTMACPGHDASCFCSAVGAGPDSARGADGLLTPVGGGFVAEFATAKGEAFLAAHAARFVEARTEAAEAAQAARAQARAAVEGNLSIDTTRVAHWIEAHFDDDYWPSLGRRCNGCGVCTMVCPTCHCFDIVDEPEGVGAGTRRRKWDSCQTGKFTVHASGHNPRSDQNARYRQRISHKFFIYPSKFGDVLCTGCGRCVRACPAGQDLVEILQTIDRAGAPAADRAAAVDVATAVDRAAGKEGAA